MRIVIKTEVPLGEPTVDMGSVTWLDATIEQGEDQSDAPHIGTARVAIVHVGDSEESMLAVLDADSPELGALHEIYFDGDWLEERFAEVGCNLMYVDNVEISPAWAHRNIECAVVRRLCDALAGGCSIAVVRCESTEEARFWERMGFEMTRAPSEAHPGYMHLRLCYRRPRVIDPNCDGRFLIVPDPDPSEPARFN